MYFPLFPIRKQKKELLFQQFLYCIFPFLWLYVALADDALFVYKDERGHLAHAECRYEGRVHTLLVADERRLYGVVLEVALAVND